MNLLFITASIVLVQLANIYQPTWLCVSFVLFLEHKVNRGTHTNSFPKCMDQFQTKKKVQGPITHLNLKIFRLIYTRCPLRLRFVTVQFVSLFWSHISLLSLRVVIYWSLSYFGQT
jgi:hypothetical protein